MTTVVEQAHAAAPGPWFYATLVTPCRKCGMAPGEPCTGPRGRNRQRFHMQRYEDARIAAGYPLKRQIAPDETIDIDRPQRRYVTEADSHLDPPSRV